MRASRSKLFVHFPASEKSKLIVSVCLPCRRIVAAAPLGSLLKMEQKHVDASRHAVTLPAASKQNPRD